MGRRWRQGGRGPKEGDVCDEPPHRAGRKRRSEGCGRGERQGKMAASWTVGVLASMAGGRDGGGGRTAAAMPSILHHGEEAVKVAVGDVLKAAILNNNFRGNW